MDRRVLQHQIDKVRQVGTPGMGYPHHVANLSMIYLMCSFDRRAARRLVPENLRIHDTCTGPIAFVVGRKFGKLSPPSQFYLCIEVEGRDSPDGTPGHFEVGIFNLSNLSESYRSTYNARGVAGEVAIAGDGDRRRGVATSAGRAVCSVEVKPTGDATHQAGFTNYLAENLGGGVSLFPVMCDYQARPAEVLAFDILANAPDWLRELRPQVLFAWAVDELSYTLGEVHELGEAASDVEARHADLALLRSFSQLGKPAVIADATGLVHHANPPAQDLLGIDLAEGRRLRLALQDEEDALRDAIGRAAQRSDAPSVSEALRVSRSAGEAPLIARVLPIALRRASALIVLTDPVSRAPGQLCKALRLLGLTPWEAKIASRVGMGRPAQQVAEEMGTTASTVRTALKLIYGKLSINRQSELARLVTKLETL